MTDKKPVKEPVEKEQPKPIKKGKGKPADDYGQERNFDIN